MATQSPQFDEHSSPLVIRGRDIREASVCNIAAEPCPVSAPAILHIPHASRRIPDSERRQLLLSDEDLHAELLRMTDAFTDEIFRLDPSTAMQIAYPVSRLVCDPERFPNDADEPMASRGRGSIYSRTSEGRPLRKEPVPDEEREALLAKYYSPHHERLTAAVSAALDAHGFCLIVDCHSFPSVPHPCDLDQSQPRPDICIGTDSWGHTPPWLRDLAVDAFNKAGYKVAVNRPFSGALVPAAYYRKDARVLSVMVEVSRALYMDEASGAKSTTFEKTVERCRKAVMGMAGSLKCGQQAIQRLSRGGIRYAQGGRHRADGRQ